MYNVCTEMQTRRCGPLPMIMNAVLDEYNNSYFVGDAVNISCLPGYTPASVTPGSAHLSGRHDDAMTSSDDDPVSALTVMCRDDLTWSSPQRVCRSMCTATLIFVPPTYRIYRVSQNTIPQHQNHDICAV